MVAINQVIHKLMKFLVKIFFRIFNIDQQSIHKNENSKVRLTFSYSINFMFSRIKKFAAEVSFRERITTMTMIHTQFFITLFAQILSLSNIIIMAERNQITQLSPIFLFIFHTIRFDIAQKIISLMLMLVLSLFIFFYFLLCRNRSRHFGLFAKILPVTCAMLLVQIEAYIRQNLESNLLIYNLLIVVVFVISSIWIIKLTAFPQNYITKHSKLTKLPSVARSLLFIIQILALILEVNMEKFLIFTLVCDISLLIHSLCIFQHICKDLEYLYFLIKYLTSIIGLFYLLEVEYFLPENAFTEYMSFIIFLCLLASGVLKTIFQKKYSRILNKKKLTALQIIVLYNLLLEQRHQSSTKSTSIFMFSPNAFAENLMMKRFFQMKNQRDPQEPEQVLFIKKSTAKLSQAFKRKLKNNSQQSTQTQTLNLSTLQYIIVWLEKQQVMLQSDFFTLYLCFSYLVQQKYLKSIQYLMKARKMRNFEDKQESSSMYELIQLQLENYKSKHESLNFIVEQEESCLKSCFINHQYKTFLDLNHIDCISMEFDLQELIKKIEKLFDTTTSLLTILSNNFCISNTIPSQRIKELLLQKISQKHQISELIEKMHSQGHYNKKFIFLNYVYLNMCCSQSYTVFNKLYPLLEVITDTNKYLENKSFETDMMVMVSFQDEYLGVIEHANIMMKAFFDLKQDRIKSKTERIQKIIPKFVASQHNDLMMHFKRTGRSHFIGQRNKLIVIRNEQPYEAEIDIKMFVLLDGRVSLTSRIILMEETSLILFNSIGQIFQNNLKLSMNTSIKQKGNTGILNFFTFINIDLQCKVQKIIPQVVTTNFQNKLAKITIESLEIQGNVLGICKIKFLNKIFLNNQQIRARATQQLINQFKSLSEKENHKHSSQDIKSLDLELKIWDMKMKHNPHFFWLTFTFIIFLIVSLLIVGYSFRYIELQFTYSSDIAKFYTTIVNGFRTRFFQINNRYILLHAINNNIISDDIASQYNISSLSQYIKDTATSYLSYFDVLDPSIIKYSISIPTYYMQKVTDPLVDYISPYQFQISWISMVSLMKSFYHQTLFDQVQNFQTLWNNFTLTYNTYLSNQFSFQINNNVYKAIINNSISSQNIIGNNINELIYLMSIILFLLTMAILFIIYKIYKQTEEYISLLSEIDLQVWKEQGRKIKLIKESLKELTHMMIINYQIDYEFQSIRYYVGEGNLLMMQHGEIYFQKIEQYSGQSQKSGHNKIRRHYHKKLTFNNISIMNKENQFRTKKQFEEYGYIKTNLYYIIIIILFTLPLYGMYVWSIFIFTSNYNAIIFFYNYVNSIATFRISQSIMLNIIATELIVPNITKFNNMNVNTIIPTLKTNIFHRSYEDILKNSLSWDMASNFLFKSNCNKTDQLCKALISGTLTETTPSALMQFSNLNFMLYSQIKSKKNFPNIYQQLCQLWLTYQNYLRPILLQAQLKGLTITNSQLSLAQNELKLIFQKVIIPFLIIFLVMSYWISYKIFKESHEIKRQILMSTKVDYIINKVKFWSYFTKLK